MSRIQVELEDLRKAEARLVALIEKLREDQQYVKQQIEWLMQNWRGASAEALRNRLQAFMAELTVRIGNLEERKMALSQYSRMMEQADRQMG
ncbi:WXG100 family type VII secretion target [Paenibacillus turpanensis]|uniref:WXG100 family type VII secretion target n=1 Tax=Paenibacillus turpanensis TaxID=2689078 RepID=UPI00140B9F2C|nr:WXG100 family type VII secretion target [Paenibacillus turpanensis]